MYLFIHGHDSGVKRYRTTILHPAETILWLPKKATPVVVPVILKTASDRKSRSLELSINLNSDFNWQAEKACHDFRQQDCEG